jgi:periplasmic divalent cation tolerance protein
MPQQKILVGWTTVDSAEIANKLAVGLTATRLAACVIVDGPVTSHYWWENEQLRATEWRLWVKFPADRSNEIFAWLRGHHPYAVPQWVVVEAAAVSEPYRDWIVTSTRHPFPEKSEG